MRSMHRDSAAGLSLLNDLGRGFKRAMADVAPVVHSFKLNFSQCLISAVERFSQRVGCRGYAEDAAACSEQLSPDLYGSGVEDLHTRDLSCSAEPGDRQAGFVAAGISAGAGDHADGCTLSPAQIDFGEASIDAGFERADKIAS